MLTALAIGVLVLVMAWFFGGRRSEEEPAEWPGDLSWATAPIRLREEMRLYARSGLDPLALLRFLVAVDECCEEPRLAKTIGWEGQRLTCDRCGEALGTDAWRSGDRHWCGGVAVGDVRPPYLRAASRAYKDGHHDLAARYVERARAQMKHLEYEEVYSGVDPIPSFIVTRR